PWCQHCDVGKGCRIYDQRPKLCADFACLWLQSHQRPGEKGMADDLRPDRCKVVFSPTTNDDIMAAITMPGSPGASRPGGARRLADTLVSNGVRVVAGMPESTTKVMIDRRGEREVTLTEPDENGMQWGNTNERGRK